jgi:hypothetical protein
MHLVSPTKAYIQQYRDDKWDDLLTNVKSFCEKRVDFTIEQHYRVDIFCASIDSQLQELNRRFSEHAVELLIIDSALDPRATCESFRIDDICQLVDFTGLENEQLEIELNHYKHNVV